jgi:hypothetical protein
MEEHLLDKVGRCADRSGFPAQLGFHSEVLALLRKWAGSKPAWSDVALILGPENPASEVAGDEQVLEQLKVQGRSADKEFERRVASAFSLLGLRVMEYGQGTGRRADGVAICMKGSWAVVFDAKLRRELYKLGALAHFERGTSHAQKKFNV